MEISIWGALVTFQVTFTELFIASTVIASVAYKYGWRSAAIGSILGLITITSLSFGLGNLAQEISMTALDWISSLLLFGFGIFLYYEFWSAHKKGEGNSVIEKNHSDDLKKPLQWTGVAVAAWGLFAEGLEIMVVWLAISLKQGMTTASLGVGLGLLIIALITVVLGRSGVFEKVSPKYLDFIAGTLVTAYGLYFLYEAIKGSHS
jgi:uncharacterized membrane protein